MFLPDSVTSHNIKITVTLQSLMVIVVELAVYSKFSVSLSVSHGPGWITRARAPWPEMSQCWP